ncbi:family 16 glycosylhydrolase, partial [Bacteroidota bacterium]
MIHIRQHVLSVSIIIGIFFCLLFQNTIAQYYPYTDPDNTAGWTLTEDVSDEFNGTVVDASKWFVLGTNGDYRTHWKGRAPSQFTSNNVTVSDGYLTITSKWDPGFNFADETKDGYKYGEPAPITTGAIISEKSFLHGYMEIRCQAAEGPISSSFWSTGSGGELDVFEHYGENPKKPDVAKKYHTSFHDWRSGSPTFGTRIWTNEHLLDYRVADDFHIYGFEWDENYV